MVMYDNENITEKEKVNHNMYLPGLTNAINEIDDQYIMRTDINQ